MPKVTLREQFAKKKMGGIEVPVPFHQSEVRVKNDAGRFERVGFVEHKPGATVCFIRPYPDAFCAAVTAEVVKLLDGASPTEEPTADTPTPAKKGRKFAKPREQPEEVPADE